MFQFCVEINVRCIRMQKIESKKKNLEEMIYEGATASQQLVP